ncbi:2-oxoacid:acceptor oxidoreductase family protein [Desulfitibacter alkalitolerans]|uniref:2-oxoacid:acceptor oxidoreductase family protein n=1 Tax=Desulfitibacter alkalitolerans TaxID=264641 RepID=UPI0004867AA5|nr:2-oxoacid:acceptor oxidoreductase family protein [Desulfitibacter alkalitolerans]
MAERMSIRMSGLGGQGVVTAAHILSLAATLEGKESTVNPFFGAEKRLAPAESYVRISTTRISERGEVLSPNIIMIFHPHVITLGKCYTMPFFDGLQKNGIILVNSDVPLNLSSDELKQLNKLNAKLFYIPATQIASEVGGTELSTNMAMLGGLLGIVPLASIENIQKSLMDRFGGGQFVASGSTAALDDTLKTKYEKVTQLIEKNIEVILKANGSIEEYII